MEKDFSLCIIGEDPDRCPLGNDCKYFSYIEDRCRYHETEDAKRERIRAAARSRRVLHAKIGRDDNADE